MNDAVKHPMILWASLDVATDTPGGRNTRA